MKLSAIDGQLAVADADYQQWIARSEQPRLREEWQRLRRQPVSAPLKISVLLPTYNSDIAFLRAAIDSVIDQIYPNWQLCIVDDASPEAEVRHVLQEYAAREPRIALRFAARNQGIAATTNAALALAEGAYCALLDHDDVLSPHALLRVAQHLLRHPQTRLLYSDSDRLDRAGRRVEPFLKPDWNYELLLGQNYLNHLTVYATALLRELGGLRQDFEGSQDYELALRAIETIPGDAIAHLPEILYHWRKLDASFSSSQLGRAVQAARRAIAEHLQRRGASAQVKACPGAVLYNQIRWPRQAAPLAMLIYGTDAAAVAGTLAAWRQAHADADVHWAACVAAPHRAATELNRWAQEQPAEIIGFIAAGLQPITAAAWATWVGHSQRPGIGAVGAKYVTSDGMVLGPLQPADGAAPGARIAYAVKDADNSGYFAGLALDREVAALQAGCLLVRRPAFIAAGGWRCDPMRALAAGAELSQRLRAGGQRLIWHPFALARSGAQALDDALRAGVAITAEPLISPMAPAMENHHPAAPE